MCKNLTYQQYFINKDMFHVEHIFYFGILYNTMFHMDILVGYLINNNFIIVLFHVKHCNCCYIIFNNTSLSLIVGNDVSRETSSNI